MIGIPFSWWGWALIGESMGRTVGITYFSDSAWKKILAVTLQPLFLPGEGPFWLAPFAIFVQLILAFFLSVGIEGLILKSLTKREAIAVWNPTWRANQLSYVILAALCVIWLVFSIVVNR
jgi:hypothetical protein